MISYQDFGINFCAKNDGCDQVQEEVLLKKGLEFEIINIYDDVFDGKNIKVIELDVI